MILVEVELHDKRAAHGRRGHVLVRLKHGVIDRVLCVIWKEHGGVIDLPQINGGCEVERAVGAQQVGLDLLVVAVDEGRAEPVASVRTRHVQVHFLFVGTTASAYCLLNECLSETAQVEVAWKCAVMRRYDGIGRVLEVAFE